MKKAFALTLLTIAGYSANCPMPETWAQPGAMASWDVANNWNPNSCIPGSATINTDIAQFNGVGGAGPTISVSLDSPAIAPGLNVLNFNSPGLAYTISGMMQADALNFNANGPANPFMGVEAGTQTIAAQINIAAGTVLVVSVANSSSLTMTKGLRGTNSNFTFSGPGMMLNQWDGTGLPDVFNTFDMEMGTVTISGGTFTNNNNLLIGNGALGTEIVPGTFTVTGGNFMNTNSATITDNGVGGSVSGFNNINLSSGSITVSNSGTLLNSATMAGGAGAVFGTAMQVIVTGGKLTVTNTGALQCTNFGAGARVSCNGNMSFSNATILNQNSGPVSSNGGVGSSIETAANITLSSGTLTNINTGVLSNGGIGSLVSALGQMQINGGIFTNNATAQSPQFNVASGGTLSGNGTFSSPGGAATTAVTNAGTVIPGDPGIGTMTILGSYVQTPTGILIVDLSDPSAFSQLVVTGTAQLAGTLEVSSSVADSGGSFQIIQAGNVMGTFSTTVSLGSLVPTVHYFPTYVLVSFPEVLPLTYLNYIESLFFSVTQKNLFLDRQMGDLRQRFIFEKKEMKTVAVAEDLVADNNPQVMEKQEQLKESLGTDRPWNLYFGPTGEVGRVLTKRDATGFHYDTIGALAGFDYAYEKFGIGFMAQYNHFDGRGVHHWGKFDINEAYGTLYATYIREAEKNLAFNMILGGGYEWYNIRRNTATGVAKGHPQGLGFDALAGMEYTFEKRCGMPDNMQIVPLLNAQYIYLHVNKYEEHGGMSVNYDSQNGRSLRSTVGLRINNSWEWANVAFKPEVNLGWQYEYFDRSRDLRASVPGLVSHLEMPRGGRNVALAGIDFLVTLFDRYGIEANYNFEWSDYALDHFFYVGCNFRF